MRILQFISTLLGIGFIQCALGAPITTIVDGGYSYGKHLHCKAYLHTPNQTGQNNSNNLTLHFFQNGTGAYTTYFDPPWTNSTDYYLTIDKPGIIPNNIDPNEPIVDRKLFDYYTTDTMITCAQNALYWADNYLGNSEKTIVLGGHSEGSIVMTNLVYRVLLDKSKTHLQSEIKSLFLSGVVMDNMSDVIAYQLKGISYDEFMLAYKMHDDNYFYKNYQVGWYWVDTALNTNYPLTEVLSHIEKLSEGRALPIEMFQGLFDKSVPTKSVLKFETENDIKPQEQQLMVYARYYDAGHDLNNTAISDMELLIDKYFQNSSSPDLKAINTDVGVRLHTKTNDKQII